MNSEGDKRKEEQWVKSIVSKVSSISPSGTIQQLLSLVEDSKLKEGVVSTFLSTFEPMFDPEEKKEFIPCEYYRVGKAYRQLYLSFYNNLEIDHHLATSIFRR